MVQLTIRIKDRILVISPFTLRFRLSHKLRSSLILLNLKINSLSFHRIHPKPLSKPRRIQGASRAPMVVEVGLEAVPEAGFRRRYHFEKRMGFLKRNMILRNLDDTRKKRGILPKLKGNLTLTLVTTTPRSLDHNPLPVSPLNNLNSGVRVNISLSPDEGV